MDVAAAGTGVVAFCLGAGEGAGVVGDGWLVLFWGRGGGHGEVRKGVGGRW